MPTALLSYVSVELEQAIGRAIRRARKQANLVQRELAYRCGVDQMTISKLETGKRTPAMITFCLIAKATGMTPSELMRLVEAEKPDVRLYEG